MVRIFGRTVELICHKRERIIFEAITCRFASGYNRASKEFKVTLMMSREYDVHDNFLALRVLSLDCRWHRLAKHVQIFVIVPTTSDSTLAD
jgi:phage-related protein